VAGRVGDRRDCGHGGIGEELRGRVPAGRGAFGGVSGEDGGGMAGGERPLRQAREHTGGPTGRSTCRHEARVT
jgi:hypothetical protein